MTVWRDMWCSDGVEGAVMVWGGDVDVCSSHTCGYTAVHI